MPLTLNHEADPDSMPTQVHSGKDNLDITIPTMENLEVPIALRKGVRTCTNHPISKFVSYAKLSPSYKAFVSTLDSMQVPNTIRRLSNTQNGGRQLMMKSKHWRKITHGC